MGVGGRRLQHPSRRRGSVISVDEVDRTSEAGRGQSGRGLHKLFIDGAEPLRGLACHCLYTWPIELAYSLSAGMVRDRMGGEFVAIPNVPVIASDGSADVKGMNAARSIVEARVRAAGAGIDDVFESDALDQVLSGSGGHLRSLFRLVRGLCDDSEPEDLPFAGQAATRQRRRQGNDLRRLVTPDQLRLLEEVATSGERTADEDWYELLYHQVLLNYRDELDEEWYRPHPLLSLPT